MKITQFLFITIIFLGINNLSNAQRKRDYLVTLKTDFGTMHLILFDETPKHKKNFIKLSKAKFYNDLLFHRIIENFMIQGGDPDSRNATLEQKLGDGGDNLPRIPFEFQATRIHKKGALAAARDGNPEKASSACQFYIVQGKKFSEHDLTLMQARNNMNYTAEQREIYKNLGGTPHLDNNYTVFGEVIDNISVLDSIAKQPRNQVDRPLKNIKMTIEVKKMRKKKITKKYGYQFQ